LGRGLAYSYNHVHIAWKQSLSKEISRAEHEYINLSYTQGLDRRYSAIWLVPYQQDISSYPASREKQNGGSNWISDVCERDNGKLFAFYSLYTIKNAMKVKKETVFFKRQLASSVIFLGQYFTKKNIDRLSLIYKLLHVLLPINEMEIQKIMYTSGNWPVCKQLKILKVMFNKRVGVFYHNIKHDA
jgi:hypothetical protein